MNTYILKYLYDFNHKIGICDTRICQIGATISIILVGKIELKLFFTFELKFTPTFFFVKEYIWILGLVTKILQFG